MSAPTVSIESEPPSVQLRWGVKIPLRDGARLNATLYLPEDHPEPTPVIFGLTPYIGQVYHERGLYFASHGYPFLAVDARGRGNSEGQFKPNINEGRDGHDIVEWIARQTFCNGRVAMVGGSYSGFDQWNTAREFPPHLATIVPVASPYMAVDFPMRSNIASPYLMQWLTLVSGRTSQDKIFADQEYWAKKNREFYESGQPFKNLDGFLGNPSSIFQEWLAHPTQDAYWDEHNPGTEHYEQLQIPILTITGSYDADQLGALMHYRQYMKHTTPEGRARHFLVIGPWDHAGTAAPKDEIAGLKVGPASLIDLKKLHLDWYAWTMQGAAKPEFLKGAVAYYVMGSEEWRYADSLQEITSQVAVLHLGSTGNPTDPYMSGSLTLEPRFRPDPDSYVYDPRDTSLAAVESTIHPEALTDQRIIHASTGRQLVYHTLPYKEDVEISGFFRLAAWISIDQPDTDFLVAIFEMDLSGKSILLTVDLMRARYRESLRKESLVRTEEPLLYDFNSFTFISRVVKRGHRLRLVIGPFDSIYTQRNFNGGGPVSGESVNDARIVTVRLYHDESHPSALHVPIGSSSA